MTELQEALHALKLMEKHLEEEYDPVILAKYIGFARACIICSQRFYEPDCVELHPVQNVGNALPEDHGYELTLDDYREMDPNTDRIIQRVKEQIAN